MKRLLTQNLAEIISEAYLIIPDRIHPYLSCEIFEGDPVFAGISVYENINDGRSYRNTSHVLYPYNISRPALERLTTLVLVGDDIDIPVVIHELGHVLGFSTEFDLISLPTTEYAENDDDEAFAEAFTSWLISDYGDRPDDWTIEFFESLGL